MRLPSIVVLVCLVCLLIPIIMQTSSAAASLDNSEFVKQVYRDFLGREADTEGLKYWTGQLDSGSCNWIGLIEQFLHADELQGNIAPVVGLYFTYYQGNPTYENLMYWVKRHRLGMSLDDISVAMAKTTIYSARYLAMTNDQFFSHMYEKIYGRQPDWDVLAYWTEMLNAGKLTRAQIMIEFAFAEENLLRKIQ